MQLDAVEVKGLIETSLIDWPGKLATVVFLPGCNLRCGYCHARDIIAGNRLESISLAQTVDYVSDMDGWIDGIVISGGEPTLHPELSLVAAEIKSRGIAVKLDTNGTRPHVIEYLIAEGLIDAIAMDVKAPLDYRYLEMTRSVLSLDDIRRSIGLIMASSLDYEFRTTVAPFLLSPTEVGEIAQSIQGARRYSLQPFSPHVCLDPEMEKEPPCPSQYLEDAARLARGFVKEVVVRSR